MPKTTKKAINTPKTKVKDSINITAKVKDVVCGHDEITHPENCHDSINEGEAENIGDCELLYLKCGEHGEHYEKQCQSLCV